jgi:hypothetical protein
MLAAASRSPWLGPRQRRRQAQRAIVVAVKKRAGQAGKIRRLGQRLHGQVKARLNIADIGPERGMERIFAIARIMGDQANVELIITGQEQRGLTGTLSVTPPAFSRVREWSAPLRR